MGLFDWLRTPKNEKIDKAIKPEIIANISIKSSSKSTSQSELNSKSKKSLKYLNFEEIGNVDPICPNCSVSLEKMPHRKMKCPSCSKFIYVRTRPSDRKNVLVTGSQVLLIEEQRAEQSAIIYGYYETYLEGKKRFEKEKALVTRKLGINPSYSDVKLSLYNKELLEHANLNEWGLYRNTKFNMAEILKYENNLSDALYLYLEICYLDINGPNNITSGISNSELLKRYPHFNPKQGLIAPGIVKIVKNITKELDLEPSEINGMFFDAAKKQQKALKLPIPAEEAWLMLEKEL